MESEDQYFHLLPEIRHLMVLSSKPPIFPAAAVSDHLYSFSPQLPSPPLPHPPSISATKGGICSSQSRWPRQETLTLLEIRARLDPQFREAGPKAPLWDEVARIMAEEHGYQRSGRKCREKLDNLYKYYKKTKEGKIGKQEGKHYRFFRQLEALYCPSATTPGAVTESSNPSIAKNLNLLENQNALLFSTSSDSTAEEEEDAEAAYSRTKSWITELVEAQMKRMLEMQEAWFEKMMRSFERMEQERVRREESWRREEAARHERERRRLASERASAEEREALLITALEKIIQQRERLGPAIMVGGGEEREEMECDLSRAMGVL